MQRELEKEFNGCVGKGSLALMLKLIMYPVTGLSTNRNLVTEILINRNPIAQNQESGYLGSGSQFQPKIEKLNWVDIPTSHHLIKKDKSLIPYYH